VLATEIDEIMKRCFRSDCAMALTLALIARPIAALAYRLRFPDLSALAIPTTLWGSYQEAEQRLAQRGQPDLATRICKRFGSVAPSFEGIRQIR